jgi:hypothetical protein
MSQYRWSVNACNSAGCGAQAIASTNLMCVPPATNLTASCDPSTHTATFSWSAAPTATYYLFHYRDTVTNVSTDLNVTSTTQTASGLTSNQYRWSVVACSPAGCGAQAIASTNLSCSGTGASASDRTSQLASIAAAYFIEPQAPRYEALFAYARRYVVRGRLWGYHFFINPLGACLYI